MYTAKMFCGKLRCHNTVTRSRNYRKTEHNLIRVSDTQSIHYIQDYCLDLQGNQIYLVDNKTLHHIAYIHDGSVKSNPMQVYLRGKLASKFSLSDKVLEQRIINFGNDKISQAIEQCKHGDFTLHSLILSKRSRKRLKRCIAYKTKS